jgi:hypothetical protein
MNNYLSLIIVGGYGLAGFVATMLWIKHKASKNHGRGRAATAGGYSGEERRQAQLTR